MTSREKFNSTLLKFHGPQQHFTECPTAGVKLTSQKLHPYNINVSLHLLFLALHFISLIYKMVDNCVDTN